MQQNVGTLDKVGRIAISMVLLAVAWKRQDKPAVIAALNAGMLISSASSGFCPLYKVMKVNTVGKPF